MAAERILTYQTKYSVFFGMIGIRIQFPECKTDQHIGNCKTKGQAQYNGDRVYFVFEKISQAQYKNMVDHDIKSKGTGT